MTAHTTVPAIRRPVACLSYFDGWLCTRPTGHRGRHNVTSSCGVKGRRVVVAVWGDDVHKAARDRARDARSLAVALADAGRLEAAS